MLVKITDRCTMQCTHCMEDARPEGADMSMETFIKVVDFIEKNDFAFIMLSGGEPTDHPQFCEFVRLAKDRLGNEPMRILVLSNGLFWRDEERRNEYMALGVQFQVINDPRYYPTKVDRIEHPNVLYDDKIMAPLSPFGRAKANGFEAGRLSPLCFNLRSAARNFRDFRNAVMFLRQKGKMCIPSIITDGSIVAGESKFCHKIGTVGSSNLELTNRLVQMRCNACGLVDNLTPELRAAIGED